MCVYIYICRLDVYTCIHMNVDLELVFYLYSFISFICISMYIYVSINVYIFMLISASIFTCMDYLF
jgi:hypothetical protein